MRPVEKDAFELAITIREILRKHGSMAAYWQFLREEKEKRENEEFLRQEATKWN